MASNYKSSQWCMTWALHCWAQKKELGVSPEHPFFTVGDKIVYFLADNPHCFKALRNMLKVKLVDKETKEYCNWDLIRKAFYADDQQEKLLSKLCQRAIELPDGRDKMRVGYATKTISGSMVYAIGRMLAESWIVDDDEQAPYLLKVMRTICLMF